MLVVFWISFTVRALTITSPLCLWPSISSAGFLIVLPPKRLCLLVQNQLVILGRCDVTNPAQQWTWLGGARLIHTQSTRCLWADPNPHLPVHAHLVRLGDCDEAPAWTCYNTKGAFGLAEENLYLKEQGVQLVIGGNIQTSEWRKYDINSGGNQRMTSLCPETGEGKHCCLAPMMSELCFCSQIMSHVMAWRTETIFEFFFWRVFWGVSLAHVLPEIT